MSELTIVARDGGYTLAGELAFATVPAAWRQSQDWFAGGTALAVDLAAVSHADSAGLALLLEWLRAARRTESRVMFRHVPAQIGAIARLTALEPVLAPAIVAD